MDPYLEAYWLDVHGTLVIYSADLLNSQLPRGLLARTQERVGIEADEEWARSLLIATGKRTA